MKHVALLLLIALSFLTACNRKSNYTVKSFSVSVPSEQTEAFKARLAAALEIMSLEERGKALTQLALDAAESTEGEVTIAALDNINALGQRDRVAEQCAAVFRKAGKPELATRVAKMIVSLELRDRVLSAIASGGAQEQEASQDSKIENGK